MDAAASACVMPRTARRCFRCSGKVFGVHKPRVFRGHQPQVFDRQKGHVSFALRARESTVIFDAEDRPERDQLKSRRRASPRAGNTLPACRRVRVERRRMLADPAFRPRLFPMVSRRCRSAFDCIRRWTMPLGGTSNHFRTAQNLCRELGGWDAFNVTEDADLGIHRPARRPRRHAGPDDIRRGAHRELGVWLKQRSRWLKGYMQTWLVHTRRPFALVRRAGLGGFLAFHLFIGGSVAASLSNPLL